jgi:hypothetical protein
MKTLTSALVNTRFSTSGWLGSSYASSTRQRLDHGAIVGSSVSQYNSDSIKSSPSVATVLTNRGVRVSISTVVASRQMRRQNRKGEHLALTTGETSLA